MNQKKARLLRRLNKAGKQAKREYNALSQRQRFRLLFADPRAARRYWDRWAARWTVITRKPEQVYYSEPVDLLETSNPYSVSI